MEKEFVLTLGHKRIGKIFIDDNNRFHCFSLEKRLEFVSTEEVDINQVVDVLLDEGSEPKFIRIPVRYLKVPAHDKQRNLAISIYSESGTLRPRIYIHDVDEKVLCLYMQTDGVMVRSLRETPESSSEPENISEYTIAERVVYFRKRSGKSAMSLARKAGITNTTWNSIERGRVYNPSIYTLRSMCDALEISLVDFFATDIGGIQELDSLLIEELKYLNPVDQRLLARRLKSERLYGSE